MRRVVHETSASRKGRTAIAGDTPRRRFDVITNVWGTSHVRLFLDLTLPNVLSPRNLPALAQYGDVVYRIFTTPSGRAQIEESALGQALPGLMQVEYVTPLGDRAPEPIWHVHWFQRAAAEAKVRGSVAIFVPPDTLWSDGSFDSMGRHLAAGYRGIACPFLQVTSETCLPAARATFLDSATGILTIPPQAMWPFARDHLHPLQILGMPGGPHTRPVFELHWPVGDKGLISRYAVREMGAVDPQRCPITFLWNADGPEDEREIYFARDVDDMFMLSVDPMAKYFQNYIVGDTCTPFDVARTTLHPLNDNGQTRVFVSRSVEVHGGAKVGSAWKRGERKAALAARQLRVGRAAMMLCDVLANHGAAVMADLVSVAMQETSLSQRWRQEPPLTVVAPADRALSRAQRGDLYALTAPGCERALVDFLLAHVVPGLVTADQEQTTLGNRKMQSETTNRRPRINGATVSHESVEREGLHVLIIDGLLTARS